MFAIFFITMPLGSKKIALAYPGHGPYNPLGKFRPRTRRVLWGVGAGIAAMLIVICVNKPDDISDNQMYEMLYSLGGGINGVKEMEPTFSMICKIAPSFAIFLLIFAALSVGGHVTAIYANSPNVFLSFLLYLPYTFVLHDMIQIRAGVAIGLLLIAVRFISERKIVPYLLLVGVAVFFHYSAIVFLPLYFLPRKKLNKWLWTGILLVSTALGLMSVGFAYLSRYIPIGLITVYLENYMGSKTYIAAEVGAVRIFKVLIAIIMLFQQEKIRSKYPLAVPVLAMFIISQMSYLLLEDIPVMQGRFGELFAAFDIFALAMFPLISKKHYYLLFIIPVFIAIYSGTDGYRLLTYSAWIPK